MKKMTDKYGKNIGSVEQRGDKYIVKDKYGFKEGSVEKEFLSDNYNIYDNLGNKTGRVEPNIVGGGANVKDKHGTKVGTVVPVPIGGISTGGLIALFVMGIMVYISYENFTMQLSNAFIFEQPEFFTITVSNGIFVLFNLFCICTKRCSIMSANGKFFPTLFNEVLGGCVIYIGVWIVLGIIGIATGEGFFNILLMVPLGALMYCLSFLAVMIIIAFIFTIIIVFVKKEKKV